MVWIKRTIMIGMALLAFLFLRYGGAEPEPAPAGYVVVEYWEKWVGNEGAQMQVIVKDFNLNIKKGEFVTLIGHSGCGKSTVLSMLAGLSKISDGNIILAGRELDGADGFGLACT